MVTGVVAGSGKTTARRALAASLGWPFFDADDFHPPGNIAWIRAGVPLTNAYRERQDQWTAMEPPLLFS